MTPAAGPASIKQQWTTVCSARNQFPLHKCAHMKTALRADSRDRPQTPWPLVQPPPSAAPVPTRAPPTTWKLPQGTNFRWMVTKDDAGAGGAAAVGSANPHQQTSDDLGTTTITKLNT